MHVVFSHGKESGPWGQKISALAETARELGCGITSVDYQACETWQERVRKLVSVCDELDELKEPFFLVGSSMGGYVTLRAAEQVLPIGVLVLAPALTYDKCPALPSQCPLAIVHGFLDDVLPFNDSVQFAKRYGSTLHLVKDYHRLHDSIPFLQDVFQVSVKNSVLRGTKGPSVYDGPDAYERKLSFNEG